MLKIFEMFAGYGGASFALKKAGIPFECVGFSEIDKYAIKCFDKNHSNIKNFGDCKEINPKELPDFDLLTGGFPCQSFSSAGKGLGYLDTRGTLFYEIIRIAEVKKPKYMLLENVKGLTFKKHKETFDKILSELDRIGYNVNWKVLNSKEYGTPQNRERVFFVCFRKDLQTNFKFPEKEELNIFLKDILEEEVDDKYYLNEQQINNLKIRNLKFNMKGNRFIDEDREFFSTLVTNKTHNDKLNNRKINTIKFGDNIFNGIPDVSTTLLAIGKTDVSKIIHSNKIRNLTPKECFRLMGFLNDEINLDGLSDTQRYKLAGNGWDINLVSKIFRKMYN